MATTPDVDKTWSNLQDAITRERRAVTRLRRAQTLFNAAHDRSVRLMNQWTELQNTSNEVARQLRKAK